MIYKDIFYKKLEPFNHTLDKFSDHYGYINLFPLFFG
jgi:hypothetical protein